MRSASFGIALQDLIERYKLNALVLLGQHLIEAKANASCYLGLEASYPPGPHYNDTCNPGYFWLAFAD